VELRQAFLRLAKRLVFRQRLDSEREADEPRAVTMKHHSAMFTSWKICLLALALAAPALGQEALTIDTFEAAPVSLEFPSSDGDYHLVEASQDLLKWVIVGQHPGNGKPAKFKDLRSQLGDAHYYRVLTQSEPFLDALLGREWKLVALHEADEIIRPKAGRRHTMTLTRKGKVAGRNDCNSYSGTFSLVKGNWLKFGKNFRSTRMLCMSDSIEFKFFKSLHASKGFEVDGDKLKLHSGDNAEHRMEFKEND